MNQIFAAFHYHATLRWNLKIIPLISNVLGHSLFQDYDSIITWF